jgi:V8-like Glu-specific endopeptidase
MKKVILSLVMVAALTVVSCKEGENTDAAATEEVAEEVVAPETVEAVADTLTAPVEAPATETPAPAETPAAPAK